MKWSGSRLDMLVLLSAIALVCISHYRKPEAHKTPASWFPYYNFNAATFAQAPREFGPFTRWWLPGNDINEGELKREISLFAANGFAGVEIQPFVSGLNNAADEVRQQNVYSWNSPEWFSNLRAIMEQAKRSGITVDMNAGSGWPMGGDFVKPAESMKTLAVSDTSLIGGQTYDGLLPQPQNHDMKPQGIMAILLQKNQLGDEYAELKSVMAARVLRSENNQVMLDHSSLIDLRSKMQNRYLKWQAPPNGEWRIIATWVVPTGEKPSLIASRKTSLVADHMNPQSVNKAYEYLLGERTGLPSFYQNPIRAIFNDSYEFHVDRLISPDFTDRFKLRHGYDITPFLSAVFQKGHDHPAYLASLYPGAKPPFIFNEEENWRLMYDYTYTVNEVFRDNFIRTSNKWLQRRGMLHRTQAYGFPSDLIGNAGAADIPEAEQLFAEGSEGYLKLVSSGAHLYNKPVITQESFVSILRAEMTTPQKIKIWADKSFAAGINQLIYHGTPYRYNNGDFGSEGWNPFSSPHMPFINFSTGMNETDPFWKYLPQINAYLARCQYALRSGKPKTDVLIYMPFINFTETQIALNPEDILNRGYFKGVEPDITGFGVFEPRKTEIYEWYRQLWPLTNELEKKGITWEFVNDEALQKASLVNGKLLIEGNAYKTLVLANLPFMQMASAGKVHELSRLGLSLWTVGALPQKQPGYFNYKANDAKTAKLIAEAASMKNSRRISDPLLLPTVNRKIIFLKDAPFSRQIIREMSDSSQIRFLWNKSDQWQTITLQLSKTFSGSYWLNPQNGSIHKNTSNTVSYQLPPYGSVFLYAVTKDKPDTKLLTPAPAIAFPAQASIPLSGWKLSAGGHQMTMDTLSDWRMHDQLRFFSGVGKYTASVQINKKEAGKKYLLDLGKVFFIAEVLINGKQAGTLLFSPYLADISALLKPGENTIEISVTNTRLNGFIGEARKNNPHYKQFAGKEKTLLPSGMVGPVMIHIIPEN